ncbi:hypothetical protein Droror1_Dr00020935 [Drosera rotundifolia]
MAAAISTTGANPPKIIHNSTNHRFQTEDGEAYLQYCLLHTTISDEDGGEAVTVMDIVHTFVPPSKRGLGLAGRLCAAAFEHAQSRGLSVVPTCSYVSDTYLPRNPSWNSLLHKGVAKSNM